MNLSWLKEVGPKKEIERIVTRIGYSGQGTAWGHHSGIRCMDGAVSRALIRGRGRSATFSKAPLGLQQHAIHRGGHALDLLRTLQA